MVKIKICGLKRLEDIELANRYKIDYAGFVFAESKRKVNYDLAKQMKEKLCEDIQSVGVFVDAGTDEILKLYNDGIIDVAQLHGMESEDYIKTLKEKTDYKLKIIKAIEVSENTDLSKYDDSLADYLLLDSGKGSGKTFDWHLIRKDLKKEFFLAGGLNSKNITQAIGEFKPYAIDLSSGVESDGFKDENKIKKVMEAKNMNNGRYGEYGGQYISETLMNELICLEEQYYHYMNDSEFVEELNTLLKEYAGRPSLLYYAKRMTEDLGGAKIYLKREDLNHTGAHKINNVLGQVLLAKKMGKTRVIAETGAGQHGVATATAAALLDMECEVYMGELDTKRQALNVYRMELLGAKVHPIKSGTKTLKDAVNDAFRDWIGRVHDTNYVIGSTMGPHPFPMMVRDFQAVISAEAREQFLEKEGKLPDAVLACVGGGSNAMGAFYNFIDDADVKLIGCEAGGKGVDTPYNAAALTNGQIGIFHGMKSIFNQGEYGQISEVYSVSAGLDYPGVGPEHAYLRDIKRAEYVPVTDEEAVNAFEYLSKMEGIIPAIESAHAVAHAMKIAPKMDKDEIIMVCLSGRGDKDVASIAKYRGVELNE